MFWGWIHRNGRIFYWVANHLCWRALHIVREAAIFCFSWAHLLSCHNSPIHWLQSCTAKPKTDTMNLFSGHRCGLLCLVLLTASLVAILVFVATLWADKEWATFEVKLRNETSQTIMQAQKGRLGGSATCLRSISEKLNNCNGQNVSTPIDESFDGKKWVSDWKRSWPF